MLEGIENGINPGNIRELMYWLRHAALTQREHGSSQFILTSHSASVLREFSRYLESVYTLRLVKSTHQSDVRNLNTSLEELLGIGVIDGTVTEDEQGNRIVEVPPYQSYHALASLNFEAATLKSPPQSICQIRPERIFRRIA